MVKLKRDRWGNLIPKRPKHPLWFVYVALREDGVVKVGSSMSPQDRVKQLGSQMPENISLVWSALTFYNFKFEKQIRSEFSKFWIKGEWYKKDSFPGILDRLQYLVSIT